MIFGNKVFYFKGQLFINGYNIGRYWPVRGPQETLFVPKGVLRPAKNIVVLVEFDYSPCQEANDGQCHVQFLDNPILNGTTHN